MNLDKTHIQYHPDHDAVFLTFLPDRIGAKASNYGSAVARDPEFFYAAYLWVKKASVVPPVLAWIRKRIRWGRWIVVPRKVSRTWKHPQGLMEITITVVERKPR